MDLDERYAAPRRDQWGPTRKRRSGEEEDCMTAKDGGETRLLRDRLMNRRTK